MMNTRMSGLLVILAAVGVLTAMSISAEAGDSCFRAKRSGGKNAASAEPSPQTEAEPELEEGCLAVEKTNRASGRGEYASQLEREPRVGDNVTCPVMGKGFKVTEKSPYVEIGGRRYYVCCDRCADLLGKEPSRYLRDSRKVRKSDEEWKAELTPEQYRITRCGGTEAPFTGKYWDNKRDGVYRCVACGQPLFDSQNKFQSGTGWPSFTLPMEERSVSERPDTSHGINRTEVLCSRCEAHLGHVFSDGPEPTGLRYCINSGALEFTEEEKRDRKLEDQ